MNIKKIREVLNKINEYWETSIKVHNKEVKIYFNSDMFELNKLLKEYSELKGLIPVSTNSNKNYIVFPGELSNHDDVLTQLDLKDYDYHLVAIPSVDRIVILDEVDDNKAIDDFKNTIYYRKVRPESIEIYNRF